MTPDDLRDEFDELTERLLTALPFEWLGIVEKRDPSEVGPILQVSAAHRPEVVDLPRVLRLEGDTQMAVHWTTFWRLRWVSLQVRTDRPAACTFELAFRVADHRELLEQMLASPALWLAVRPRRPDGRWPRDSMLVIRDVGTADTEGVRRLLENSPRQ